MSKFIIKESSIKEDVNKRLLEMITNELKKFTKEVIFNMTERGGNYAYWESNEFGIDNFNIGYDAEKLNHYLSNTLNFRYENFMVSFV